MTDALTPDLLRDAAARLSPGGEEPGKQFMCHAVGEVISGLDLELRVSARTAFQELLRFHGVSLGGGLANDFGLDIDQEGPYGSWESQALRFDFLNLLALDLEDRPAEAS